MGQRANLIIVDGGKYQLYYSHWGANTLPSDLFWGPEHALAFIRIQRQVDNSEWLDDVWAEGGALLDLDCNRFLLFGGEDLAYDVPLRRIYLELLASVWSSWTVRWAHEGIADLAEYVGVPRDKVLSGTSDDKVRGLHPPQQKDRTDFVASVRFANGMVRLYPLAGRVPQFLCSGQEIVNFVQADKGLDRLYLDEWTSQFPTGGFHLNMANRQLDFWVAADAPDLLNQVSGAWKEWETFWHFDRFEAQLERTQGLLRFPMRTRETLLEKCCEILLASPSGSMADTIKRIVAEKQQQGHETQVNPWALRDDRLELSVEERSAILARAMSRL